MLGKEFIERCLGITYLTVLQVIVWKKDFTKSTYVDIADNNCRTGSAL